MKRTIPQPHDWQLARVFAGNGTFRGLMDTKTPLYILLGCNLANLLLDPVLIFGFGPIPALGTQGAAAATAVGEWGAAIAFLMQLQNRALLPPRPTLPKWDEVRAERQERKQRQLLTCTQLPPALRRPCCPQGGPTKRH